MERDCQGILKDFEHEHMNAKEFKNDEKARKKLMRALSSAEGQVQALQSLGALVDHANTVLARDEQTLQGFMTGAALSVGHEALTRSASEMSSNPHRKALLPTFGLSSLLSAVFL